jgi:hypothetical protein
MLRLRCAGGQRGGRAEGQHGAGGQDQGQFRHGIHSSFSHLKGDLATDPQTELPGIGLSLEIEIEIEIEIETQTTGKRSDNGPDFDRRFRRASHNAWVIRKPVTPPSNPADGGAAQSLPCSGVRFGGRAHGRSGRMRASAPAASVLACQTEAGGPAAAAQ